MTSIRYRLVIAFLVFVFINSPILYASIIDYKNYMDENGYYFRFKTNSGIERSEEGTLKNKATGSGLSVAGSYEYEADGSVFIVTFIADENGFRPISQLRKKINNQLPLNFTLDQRIDPKLLGSLAGGGLG